MERQQSFSQFQKNQKGKWSKQKCTEKQSSYILGQALNQSENSRLEFKNYQWPFTTNKNKDLELTLLKTMCSFLNRDGGTILIGVSDSQIVEGLELKNIDEVKRYFDGLKERFYPKPQGLIKTVEIPLRKFITEEQYFWIPNAYVMRIEIRQGKVDRFYTFKHDKQVLSAFREDASAVLTKDIDVIQEMIYNKSQSPVQIAKPIEYEEPDQEGLQESSNSNVNMNQSTVHENNGNYIAITNIYKKYFNQFIDFLNGKLKEKKLYNVEFLEIPGHTLFVTHQRMMKLYYSIEEITQKFSEEIKGVTINYQELQFGFPKKSLTIKVFNNEDQDFVVDTINEQQYEAKVKECNGYNEISLINIPNIDDLATIYLYFKNQKIKVYISITKPDKKQQY